MNEYTYEQFLQDKIKDEHTHAHFLQGDMMSYKEKSIKLLKDLAIVRRSQNDLKLRMRQMEEKMLEQQIQIRKLKESRAQKSKEATQKRIKQERQSGGMDSRQIFKMYLDNTFPKYKGLLKKILKILYILQDTQSKEPEQKVKFYRAIFEQGVKRFLDWLFPKKQGHENKKQIAENIVSQWKEKQKQEKSSIQKDNLILLKEASYVKEIERLEVQILEQHSTLKSFEGRIKTYERTTQLKGSEFVAHLKKMLRDSPDMEPEAHEKMQEVMKIFTDVIHLTGGTKLEKLQQKFLHEQIPLVLTDNTIQSLSKKKAAPILKKNVFGYYVDPQFDGNYTLPNPTKHSSCNKGVQTLSQDLCVLTLHPVVMVTLIDANIKPQRTRHSAKYYVRIKVNQDSIMDSGVREGFQIVWNQPFLLKDYDFPFIRVLLMHQSKGLRDYSLGGGKFSASSEEQKIVNVRKQKQFIGRVRFSLSYPKGNIYEFKITSVLLQLPQHKNVLKEPVNIQFPYNSMISFEFILPNKTIYTDKSVIILESCQQNMVVDLPKENLSEKVTLDQFTAKEGNKEVIVVLDKDWKVIIQGEIYLLICEDTEPERISEELLQAGKGKFFSVRAPPPIVTVTYNKIMLHSSIKFPLVFNLEESFNTLSIIKEQSNRDIKEEIVKEIVNPEGFLKLSEFIKAPSKIYKFFIQTLEGEQVCFRHESHLFERILKEVFLQVSYKEDEVQEINFSRKGRPQKQKLYKEFTIQTNQLMLNHYKVFTRHFKRIGFLKFKLGYTIYDNELLTESGQKKEEIEYKNPEGLCFIYLELTNAHLNSQSNGSSFTCKLNECPYTKKMKGNHPSWKEGFTFSFQIRQTFTFDLNYEIIEHTTFGSKKVHFGKVVITEATLQLGVLIVNLDGKGEDCLHFSNIRVPTSIFNLAIQSIQAEIEEEADWIGKIDPYLSLFSNNRELLKTEYLDNVGSHPVWENINQQYFISNNSQDIDKGNQDFLSVKISDYDLIGRDDYIGEVIIGTKLNPELSSTGESRVLHGNIVKDNQICGSVKIKGRFKRVSQNVFKPKSKEVEKLSRNNIVYKLVIYSLSLENFSNHEDSKGLLTVRSKENQQKRCQFTFSHKELNSLNIVMWSTKYTSFEVLLQKEQKGFFKTVIEQMGKFKIDVCNKQFILSKASIVNQNQQEIGHCRYYVQFQNVVKYAAVRSQTCCKSNVQLKSDLDDQKDISFSLEPCEPAFIFYREKLFLQSQRQKQKCATDLQLLKENVYKGLSPFENHCNEICFLKLQKDFLFECQISQKSERGKVKHDRSFKKIKYLHWQPFKYRQTQQYQLILGSEDNESFEISQKILSIYNNYLILKQNEVPIVFDSEHAPKSILIRNLSKQEEDLIPLKDDINKVFVPGRGALYYHIEDYNEKLILKLHFQYIFIKATTIFKQINKYKDVKAHLSSSYSIKTFSCSSLDQNNCFAFQNINLCLAQPPTSNTFFFSGYFSGLLSEGAKRVEIVPFKFGFRIESNNLQYRFIESDGIVIHTLLNCTLIERKYELNPPVDNTLYGMHFIQLKKIEFQINEDPTEKAVFLNLQMNNQHQKIKLSRKGQSNLYQTQLVSTFFIEQLTEISCCLQQEGYFSNSMIGTASLALSELNVTKEIVELHSEVKKKNSNIGRITIVYINKRQLDFIDVNLFSYISRQSSVNMKAQLQEIGPNKDKYQAIFLTSKGNVPRLESEDSFIVIEDPRNYQVNVTEKDSQKLLGQFKLCHELKNIGDKVTVFQPLRTSSEALNGGLIIEFEKKQANSAALDKNKQIQVHLIQFIITHVTVKNHHKKYQDELSINLKTHARNITTKPAQILNSKNQKQAIFTLYSSESCELSLTQKFQPLGSTSVIGPYLNGEERILVFTKDKKSVGVCILKIRFILSNEDVNKKREIVSLQATDLMNTEYFVKMKPYIEMDSVNKEHWPSYISQFGLGKQNIFWKLGLITEQPIDFIFKDKDILFDDLIGNAVLPAKETEQKEEKTHQLTLISSEGENRKGGNGKIKIITRPIAQPQSQSNILIVEDKKISKYLLRLSSLSKKNKKDFDETDRIQISLGSGLNRNTIYKAKYQKQFSFYMQNKELEVEFDTAFQKSQISCSVTISLMSNNLTVSEQIISLTSSQKQVSEDIFDIVQLLPLSQIVFSPKTLYFWLFDKQDEEIFFYSANTQRISKMNTLLHEKRLIIVEPDQLIDITNEEVVLLAVKNNEQLFRVTLKTGDSRKEDKAMLINEAIFSPKGKQMGFFYAEINRFYSEGSDQHRKIYIGKSRKKWIFLTIIEASLTKDLEFFSKMDPCCKFALSNGLEEEWRQTGVQDDVGMKPIWNEGFFLPFESDSAKEASLKLIVMDSEVTKDRKIGEGQISLAKLLTSSESRNEIDLFYKEKEQSGTLAISSKITNKYIIFRDIISARIAGKDQTIVLIHQTNTSTSKGVIIKEGTAYPLNQDIPIVIRYGNSQKQFRFTEMKENANSKIIFEKEFIALFYELYD